MLRQTIQRAQHRVKTRKLPCLGLICGLLLGFALQLVFLNLDLVEVSGASIGQVLAAHCVCLADAVMSLLLNLARRSCALQGLASD